MSQLTFDSGPFDPVALPPKPRTDTWYKGRVLSHSSVTLYQTCPQKWKFRYVDKVPELPRPYFSFGKSVHEGLEFLFGHIKDSVPSLEAVLDHYKGKWFRDGYETAAQEKWFFQEGERILRGFYAKHQKEFSKVFQVEYKFNVEVEGVPVTGFIDRIDVTPGGKLSIIDYKTGKPFDKARVRQDPQLTLYQIVCRQALGKEVDSVTLYHLNSLTPLTVPAHSKTLEETYVSKFVDAAKGINEEKFDPKPDAKGHCQWCDYTQICPAFSGKSVPSPVSNSQYHPLMDEVDRFGKLDQRIQELVVEKNQIASQLLTQMAQSGANLLNGHHFSVEKANNGSLGTESLRVSPKEENKP